MKPKVIVSERWHTDGRKEAGFVVLHNSYDEMEAPFFTTFQQAVTHANAITALRRMALVAL